MRSDVRAILLAAGLGTRLGALTRSTPKCLLPVRDKPVLEYWLEKIAAVGIEHALINTHWLYGQVERFLTQRRGAPCVVTAYEPTLLGSAGTLVANRAWLSQARSIVIVYADNFATMDLAGILAFHDSHELPFTLGVFETDEPHRCGIVELDAAGRILGFEEKPARPRSNLAAAGIYVMDASLLPEIESMRSTAAGAYDLGTHVLPRLVGRMQAYAVPGAIIDIGTPESYSAAQMLMDGTCSAAGRVLIVPHE